MYVSFLALLGYILFNISVSRFLDGMTLLWYRPNLRQKLVLMSWLIASTLPRLINLLIYIDKMSCWHHSQRASIFFCYLLFDFLKLSLYVHTFVLDIVPLWYQYYRGIIWFLLIILTTSCCNRSSVSIAYRIGRLNEVVSVKTEHPFHNRCGMIKTPPGLSPWLPSESLTFVSLHYLKMNTTFRVGR